MLLSGMVPRLEWASSLVRTLEACTGIPGMRRWIDDRVDEPASYPFDASGTPGKPSSPVITSGGHRSSLFGKKKKDVDFSPQHWGTSKNSGSYFAADDLDSHEDFGSTLSSHPLDRHRASLSDGQYIGSTFSNDPRSCASPSFTYETLFHPRLWQLRIIVHPVLLPPVDL
ncbi:hypothetical protein EDD15DRAFT_2422578 [Pisolithus albus]|nr:hypothetical protein EDD15DRAFT_2422578 [Pisolithus albus]